MYADGTHLKCTGNDIYSIQSSLNLDLPNISNCLTANKLTLNVTKTEFMLIGSRQKLNNLPAPPALEINSTHIYQAHSTGIIIDENFTWVNHIDTLSKKKMLLVLELLNESDTVLLLQLYIVSIGVSFNPTLIIVRLSGIVVVTL